MAARVQRAVGKQTDRSPNDILFPTLFLLVNSHFRLLTTLSVRIIPIYRDSNDVMKLLFARKMAAIFEKSHAHKEIYCFQSLTAFIRDFQRAKDKKKHQWPFWKLRYLYLWILLVLINDAVTIFAVRF